METSFGAGQEPACVLPERLTFVCRLDGQPQEGILLFLQLYAVGMKSSLFLVIGPSGPDGTAILSRRDVENELPYANAELPEVRRASINDLDGRIQAIPVNHDRLQVLVWGHESQGGQPMSLTYSQAERSLLALRNQSIAGMLSADALSEGGVTVTSVAVVP